MSKPGYNLVNYQCHELLIEKRHYYFARSHKLSMSQLGHDPQPGSDYSLAVNSMKSLY